MSILPESNVIVNIPVPDPTALTFPLIYPLGPVNLTRLPTRLVRIDVLSAPSKSSWFTLILVASLKFKFAT
jgi:hypothetical protein